MKSKGILFLATIVIAVMIISCANAIPSVTTNLHPHSGIDTTGGYTYNMDTTDLNKVSSSDDLRYQSKGKWPPAWQGWTYIEWSNFDSIPTNADVDEVRLIFEVQRDGENYPAWETIQIQIWEDDASSWHDYLFALKDPNTDETFTILAPYINSASDVNNLEVRFRGKSLRLEGPYIYTRHDLVRFRVVYTPADETEPDTNITYFTKDDGSDRRNCTWNGTAYNAYVNFEDNDIVGDGISADDMSNLLDIWYIRTGWGYWSSAQHGNLGQIVEWYTHPDDFWGGRSVYKVCGRAKDVFHNEEPQLPVEQVPEDDCCWLCIDRIDPTQPGKPTHTDDVCEEADENLYDNDAYLDFSWTASTDEPECSGIDYYEIEVYEDGSKVLDDTSSTNDYQYNSGVHGSYYKIRARAVDMAENIGEWSEFSEEVLVDMVDPSIQFNADTPDAMPNWYKDNFNVEVYMEDSDSGLCICEYGIYDDFVLSREGSFECFCNGNWTENIEISVGETGDCTTIGVDTCELYISVEDKAGNTADENELYSIDYEAPTTYKEVGIPSVLKNDTWSWRGWTGFLHYFVRDNTPIEFTCMDGDGIGPDYIEYKYQYYDGLSWTNWSGWMVYTATLNLLDGDGVYNLEYRCVDLLGNTEEAQDETDKVDTEAPITIKSVGDPKYPYSEGDWYVTNHTLYTLTCEDEEVDCNTEQGIFYKINDGEWLVYHEPFVIDWLEDGPFTLEWFSLDWLGNEEMVNIEHDYMDNTPPVIEILEPNSWEDEFGCEASIFIVKARITDAGAGVKSATADLLYANGSSTGRTCTMALQQGYWKCNLNHWNLLGEYYIVRVTALDNVDNQDYEDKWIELTYDVYFTGGSTFTVMKGESGNTVFNVKLCHGGNATGMLMTKLCGVIDLSPTLDYNQNYFNIYQEDYFHFIKHLFEWQSDPFLPLGNSPEEIGVERTVTLTVAVPENFECNSHDIRCAYIGYKFGAAYEGMSEPAEPEPMIGAISWFDITCNSDSITFGGEVSPFCGDGMKNQESEECDFSGTQTCEETYGPAGTGYHWTGEASCNLCVLSGCTEVADGNSRGHNSGGGSSSTAPSCETNWRCSTWGICITDKQFRTCVDESGCGTTNDKPKEEQACTPATAEGSSSSNGNENANSGNNLITGSAIGASPFIGGILFVLIVALAVVVTMVARRLTGKSKK